MNESVADEFYRGHTDFSGHRHTCFGNQYVTQKGFHDSPEVLDQILTEHPEVEFVQIIINYFDWESYFIASRRCYEVIRKHGKKAVIMEPVKGGVLAQIPRRLKRNSAPPSRNCHLQYGCSGLRAAWMM